MSRKKSIRQPGLAACLAGLVFIAGSGNAMAYGGYGYHHGVHAHYSHHGGIGTAGYVFLGILSFAILSHIFDDRYYRKRPAARTDPLPEYRRSAKRLPAYPRASGRPAAKPLPNYAADAGWISLLQEDPATAMQVFAVQAQQQLGSGTPKLGFALAAAANGELERGIWSMRKALASDPDAMQALASDTQLDPLIGDLNRQYQSMGRVSIDQQQNAFMIAALSYLQEDYQTARQFIQTADGSPGSVNLRSLIARAAH
ncbi:MAG: hypothetical protein MI673_04425 [Thiotrichales bacterium]|nr:hypothetical protein [Thiotrichales bacterium]